VVSPATWMMIFRSDLERRREAPFSYRNTETEKFG
jgi:hypothetical protein